MLLVLSCLFLLSPLIESTKTIFGDSASKCFSGHSLMDEICEDEGIKKYVRIKTFENKYIQAGPNNYQKLRTRCCGVKDAVGRRDVLTPGRSTTFIAHCTRNDPAANGKDTVSFEVFKWRETENKPAGHYFYVAQYYNYMYPEKINYRTDKRGKFLLHQWRGPVVGIENVESKHWLSVEYDEHNAIDGLIYGGGGTRNRKTDPLSSRPTPYLHQTFTIEIVPKECVDVKDNEKIQADESGKSQKSCEGKEDRCYWTNIWNNDQRGPECFYKKDSMCYVPANSRTSCDVQTSNAKQCEDASCCFDYQRNACYKGASLPSSA